MFLQPAYVLAIAIVFFTTSHGEFDTILCPDGPTPFTLDSNWRPIPQRFEIMTEYVSENDVMELSQAFSTTRDAIAISSTAAQVQAYWNFVTNETFDVQTAVVAQSALPICSRQPITSQSETSIVLPNTLLLKPSILLGYDPNNQINSQWGIRYDGDEISRGIPANRFKSCFYVRDIKATVSATYYVSDVNKFQAYLPKNTSIVLKLDVTVTHPSKGRKSYTYNIFRYTPNPGRGEERQALETPTGVFCADRISTLPVPSNIPERVSANSEFFALNSNKSSIISTHNLYDTEFQFTRFDVWYADPNGGSRWFHYTEIHDFAVGLSYQYNHSNDQCTVRDINTDFNDAVPTTDHPNLLQMGSPQHTLLMDDMTYQYTGEKQCRDRVWCHVWIGEKLGVNNTAEHREWYWASRVNHEELQQPIPTKLVIKRYSSVGLLFSFEFNFFNFRRRPMTIFEIDYTLANCYRALGPAANYNLAVLSFKIANDKKYPVFQNQNFLRLHIFETLMFTIFVRPIRISNLIVDQDNNDILVTFTLLDVPPRTGPVEAPLKEYSLDKVIERLATVIDAGGLGFRARYDGSKQVILRARAKSLNVAQNKQEKITNISSKVTGFWIGFVVLGLLIGTVGSFFVFRKITQ
ncbi:unnamed protein product [Rotaria sp. Silwood2]|nr:unnamed protein product [Rotaria sp. Silwood2]CAF2629518.1 unnamed protein product [Rotaria sp. Silwood2]CAF2879885.1 unnamed protein product [Rotaria sp. Silwood2]CAF3851132.1 unnamed protein product [Rotaria sp. Silwood2]CAF4199741.1 unnamed protein product [Rotaria sp. Silwood2]